MEAFRNCGWRFYLTKVAPKEERIVEGQTQQMLDGNLTHKALEVGVRDGIPLPAKYKQHQPIVDKLRAANGMKIVEWQFGITRNWTACKFFDNDVWIRGKIDVGVIGTKSAALLDYKTGKRKEDSDQLKLFSVAAWTAYPYLEKIKSSFVWLADPENQFDSEVYTPDQLPEMKEFFAYRINQIEDANRRDKWMKQPSGLCAWCPVGPDKCEYWRAYKGVK